jgi:hypothetical protein
MSSAMGQLATTQINNSIFCHSHGQFLLALEIAIKKISIGGFKLIMFFYVVYANP